MKSNFNLPKVDNYKGPKDMYHEKVCDVFIRGEHPDERSNKEFLQAMDRKLGTHVTTGNWYPGKRNNHGPNKKTILCLNNGKQYESIAIACRALNLSRTNFTKHLQGHRSYGHIGGYRFTVL